MRQFLVSGYNATCGYDAKDEWVVWAGLAKQGAHRTVGRASIEIPRGFGWSGGRDSVLAGVCRGRVKAA